MNDAISSSLGSRCASGIRTLNPGYFALVMATGIVSVGLRNNGWGWASTALLAIAMVGYGILVVLYLIRIIRCRARLADDLFNPLVSFGFFTFVAGTNVLGTRLAIEGVAAPALILLGVGTLAWLVLAYVIPWAVFLGRAEHPILKQANGTWFLWTVASQSVAVLAATLEPQFSSIARELALLAVFSWAVGVFVYVGVGVSLLIRLLLYRPDPKDFTTPYWISMGALAISVLAGAKITAMTSEPMVDATRGIVSGTSTLSWAIATWLIPPIVALGWWRHVVGRVSLAYQAPLWSMVFPLGMYAVSSDTIGAVMQVPAIQAAGWVELWLAAAVWFAVFVGMVHHLARTVLLRPRLAVKVG